MQDNDFLFRMLKYFLQPSPTFLVWLVISVYRQKIPLVSVMIRNQHNLTNKTALEREKYMNELTDPE